MLAMGRVLLFLGVLALASAPAAQTGDHPLPFDCNANGIPDHIDIAVGTSLDCNSNGSPDECDAATGLSLDCNFNGIPDECDIASGISTDCNGNGVPDSCDIHSGASQNCNSNGIPDECDIASGFSEDFNGSGVPDECETDALLTVDLDVINVSTGGTQMFELQAPLAHANLPYILLGSASGVSPGIPLGNVVLPLVPDPYLDFTLAAANTPMLAKTFGVLDSLGRGRATLKLQPAAVSTAVVGLTLHHAYAVFNLVPYAVATSNTVSLRFMAFSVLLAQRFESGAPGWTFQNGQSGLWRIATDGDCGAITAMAAYNRPVVCHYFLPPLGISSGTLVSPAIDLGPAPFPKFELHFDSIRKMHQFSSARVRLRNRTTGAEIQLMENGDLDNTGVLESIVESVSVPASWAGDPVELRFFFNSHGFPQLLELGWFVDNVRFVAVLE